MAEQRRVRISHHRADGDAGGQASNLRRQTEIRIRKAVVIPEDEVRFYEEATAPLSDADRDRFLHLLDNPPEPTPALKRAAVRRRPDA